MKRTILLTFDFSQRGKSGTGLAAGCLLAACQEHNSYNKEFTIRHVATHMDQPSLISMDSIITDIEMHEPLSQISCIAIGCYVWSNPHINALIETIKARGFKGNVILGGYQIHESTCKELYPSTDTYIQGNAEAVLPEAILSPVFHGQNVITGQSNDFSQMPSPYLKGIIPLEQNHPMVHMETMRGCQFSCNFCQHRDVSRSSVDNVSLMPLERVNAELWHFKEKRVQKINVLDPIFNTPQSRYLDVLDYGIQIGLRSTLSLQVRFEFINREFLDRCKKLNVVLEFGLQTIHAAEWNAINRANNMTKVDEAISLVREYDIPYEVSLIYGLPHQTVESFRESIEYLRTRDTPSIVAFPLMILEGTQLKSNQSRYGLVEEIIDDSMIPHVVASDSFTREQYAEMRAIANSLSSHSLTVAA